MIAYCGCVRASYILLHSGTASATQMGNPKPRLPLNVAENTRGVEYQDMKHGKGNRVFNPLKKKPQEALRGRCTICGAIRML